MPPSNRKRKHREAATKSAPTTKFVTKTPPKSSAETWVRNTLEKMTLAEKLGQLLMVPYYGGFTSTDSAEFRRLELLITQHHVGGLMLETRPGPLGLRRSQVYPAAALANLLQTRAKIPLLIAADFERGTNMRIEEGTSFPHAMAAAAGGRVEDAYTFGRITALEARAAGVPWIFAPVADVNSNPDNPIINVRSFGEDPERVAELVAAFIRGAQENGAMATAKHFPGHGDTNTDSLHLSLPTVSSDRNHLENVELILPRRDRCQSRSGHDGSYRGARSWTLTPILQQRSQKKSPRICSAASWASEV